MDEFQLTQLIDQGEHARLEFKERPTQNLPAAISGFANAGGGRILLGVSDRGEIVGCQLNNSERTALSRAARDCDPSVAMDIIHIRGQNVFVLDVKQSHAKPVQCSQGYFVREHAETRKMRGKELQAMFRKNFPPVFENMICEKFVYPDDFSLEKFRTFAKMCRFSETSSAEDILLNLDLAKKARGG